MSRGSGPARAWVRGVLALLGLLAGLGARVSPEEKWRKGDEEAGKVLARWQKAIGGADRIAALKSMTVDCEVVSGNGTPVRMQLRGSPDQYRIEYDFPVLGRLVQAFDGGNGWQSNAILGTGPLLPANHLSNQLMLDFRVPVRTKRIFLQRQILPAEVVEGRRLQPVQMIMMDERFEKWYFDPETHYRVRVEGNGPNGPVVVQFEDFRTAEGAKVIEPFRTIRIEGGQRTVITVRRLCYDEPMDRALFHRTEQEEVEAGRVNTILDVNAQTSGRKVLARIQTRVTEKTDLHVTTGAKVTTKVYQQRPNRIVVVQQVPGLGELRQGFDGKVGWSWNEVEGYREMQGTELQQMMNNADLDGPLKLGLDCPFRKLLGLSQIGGREALGVAMGNLRGIAGNFYFDTRTLELMRVESFVQAGENGVLKVTADFSDYRQVDGVALPFKVVLDNPALRVVSTVDAVRHNVPIDGALFTPRKE